MIASLLLALISCVVFVDATLVSDGDVRGSLSLFVLNENGVQVKAINTSYSILDQYTCGDADPSTNNAYLLVSSPPSILPGRTYAVVTVNLETGKITTSTSTFHIPGIFPYGIVAGPQGKVIVAGQQSLGPVLYYYLVDPITGQSSPIAQLNIDNSFIFPDSLLYDPSTNTVLHPYCNEPEHFVGVVVVSLTSSSASLVEVATPNPAWYRPVVYDPATKGLLGLLRAPGTTNATTLATFSFVTGALTPIGQPYTGTQGVTFEGADLGTDGKLYVTGSTGTFGFGKPYLFAFDKVTGEGSQSELPSGWLPVEFLKYGSF